MADTSELVRNSLPEILPILPDYVQGWYLFMDAGLDTMERNVLQAELRGSFSVKAVEDALRKHWSDADLRRRDAEKGKAFSHMTQAQDEDLHGSENGMKRSWKPRASQWMRSSASLQRDNGPSRPTM